MAIETRAAQAALDDLIDRVTRATSAAVVEGAALIEREAKGNAPVDTGTLWRSIDIEGPRRTGVARYSADVGPTVVYGRIRELGGDIYPSTQRTFVGWGVDRRGRPYKIYRGGLLRWFDPTGHPIFASHVHQAGRPYLKPATEAVRLRFRGIAARHWGSAIRGI